MSHHFRHTTLLSTYDYLPRVVQFPTRDGKQVYTSEIFAQNVFSLRTLSKTLPKPVYEQFVKQMRGRQVMDKNTADCVAHAVRVWAMDRGATHFTHWFQPQTESTAEKHDSFLSLKSTLGDGWEEHVPMDAFSGSQLIQSEPDASSFPSGGMRTTFEARGYTVWDTTSPMFLQSGPHGTMILYIPSIFISYNGEALDEKTVLLRSAEALSKAAVELLNVIGNDNSTVNHVYTTLGTEQEFFLVDRGLYALRPDLKITGRTLIGAVPPKHQQMEDHYFGRMPSRAMAAISEAELELLKLGVPVKTRHNEVAPAQFEMAPIFEDAALAVDHNLLTMEVLSKIAHKHKLKVLFHEKPFKGVNGSGKHCNWSMSTNLGENLLEPTAAPESNTKFLLFLVAVLNAVYTHGGLLRAGIASASNDHRLGANEAPPGIISVFLGTHLTDVLDAIVEDRPISRSSIPHVEHIKVGSTTLDVKISTMPEISRDLTDRNRTSPFAFTGNKFEFRAVGSKQSPSFPITVLNAAVASSIREVTAALRKQQGDKSSLTEDDKMSVIKEYINKTKNVRFEGDNYSDAWVKEAESRGLPNIKKSLDAFTKLLEPVHAGMLTENGIFTKSELHSRHHILLEKYTKDILIEASTLRSIVTTKVLPAAYEFRKSLAEAVKALNDIGAASPEENVLEQTAPAVRNLQVEIALLADNIAKVSAIRNAKDAARAAQDELLPVMEDVRVSADILEELIDDKIWPLPKYSELLFT